MPCQTSVICRAFCRSNAVGVSRMPLSGRLNAVPLSVECRIRVGLTPCHRLIYKLKKCRSNAVLFYTPVICYQDGVADWV
ncbi:MAG: hypothetical protein NTV66_08920 [Methylococcales bacterium]|nr:hypothetical protein [Methylococcales bacterium]